MRIFEIGTGYTSIPAKMGAATEIVVEELTKSIMKSKHYVTIIDIKDKKRVTTQLPIIEVYMPYFLISTDTKLGIIHKAKRVLYSISLTYKICHLLFKQQQDNIILHFHNQYNLYFFLKLVPVKIRKKTTIAYTNHSYIWQNSWDQIKNIVHKRYFQEIYCCQHADKVFVLNEKTQKHLVNHLKVDIHKIHLIANGVNTNVYYPLNETKLKRIANSLHVENKHVFFQAGSICERKNQLTAIKLLLPLMKNDESIIYLYAGGIISLEYKKAIDNFVSDNNISKQVIYVGEVQPGEKLNEFYNIAKAFIFPSTSEGFSLVILEAMAAGTPVFIDANSDLKVPNENGQGCICYSNEKDFEKKIIMILDENKRKYHSLQARSCIEKNYSWDIVANNYLNYF